MDVLALEKVELHNAVATLGTAMTKEQLRLLQLLHVPIVVCYDGDKAGRNATYNFGKMAREAQLPFEIVDNNYGLIRMKSLMYTGRMSFAHCLIRRYPGLISSLNTCLGGIIWTTTLRKRNSRRKWL